MNKAERDILLEIKKNKYINQRILAEKLNYSLGMINNSIKNLVKQNYLTSDMMLSKEAIGSIEKNRPRNAIILAAGVGMRMVPINAEYPKALIEVHGEVLIERIINQLHEVGINEIYVVVGFLKEQFEYLIDKYDVQLVCNAEYAKKNNLYSLSLVADYISNSYIVPCDIWCKKNPFSTLEMYSWYMVNELPDENSTVRINRKGELVRVDGDTQGNTMIGISYLLEEDAYKVRLKINSMCNEKKYDYAFWEETLFEKERMICYANMVSENDFIEINTYEQLREIDENSDQLKNVAIETITNAFGCLKDEITNIGVIKKGMTNRSFRFACLGKTYIMRVPGVGTDKLINREQEVSVYHAINGKGICDEIVYINSQNGYKITKYIQGTRTCDPFSQADLEICMSKLRTLHKAKYVVPFEFDVWERIGFYESLWNGESSIFKDYDITKKNIISLRSFVEKNVDEKVLAHIDSVPDNFLIYKNDYGTEVRLIDWEYAGMQDPHIDIAMFSIYSFYDKMQIDNLISIYFEGECPRVTRLKIYCYIAICGLLWSNWCEYKRQSGVEFGEYALRQYRYAKEYYKIVKEEGIFNE